MEDSLLNFVFLSVWLQHLVSAVIQVSFESDNIFHAHTCSLTREFIACVLHNFRHDDVLYDKLRSFPDLVYQFLQLELPKKRQSQNG